MIPDLPEILVIAFIAVAVFGLSTLDELGEFVWRLRRRWFDVDS